MGQFDGAATVKSLELHVQDLTLRTAVGETFDDLINKKQYQQGPLIALNELRRKVADNEEIRVVLTSGVPRDEIEGRNLRILFNKASFVDVIIDNVGGVTVVRATKRPPFEMTYDFGLALREFTSEDDILRCHEFAEKINYFKDFNYDYEVSRQFDPNADHFGVVNSRGDILALGRPVLRVPGYSCPFMHACLEDGSHYPVPERYVRICEVMGLYVEGREGSIAFKKIMEALTQYAYYIAKVDSIWTTYDETDSYTGTYYRRKLLMEETGAKLTYRNFGGLWNLIFTDKIKELRDINVRMFVR